MKPKTKLMLLGIWNAVAILFAMALLVNAIICAWAKNWNEGTFCLVLAGLVYGAMIMKGGKRS